MSQQPNNQIILHQNLDYYSKTDVGGKRTENQDRFGQIFNENFKIFVVADGMGGANGGSTASQMTIDYLTEKFLALNKITPEDIYQIIMGANDLIFNRSIEQRHLAGMGTTCVLLIFTEDNLYICNVGDSRAYLIRDQEIRQLTEDHTLVNELFKAGIINAEQMENHPVSHMLTRCLGPAVKVELDCYLEKPGVLKGDTYVLCSDGLYNLVADTEIRKIVSKNSPEEAANKLISIANERGGIDNITVSIIRVNESPFDLDQKQKHFDLVPVSFKDMPGYFEEESFERVLLRHSDGFERYGSESSEQKSSQVFSSKGLWVIGLLVVLITATYFLKENLYKPTENQPIYVSNSSISASKELKEKIEAEHQKSLSTEIEIDPLRLQAIADKYLLGLKDQTLYQELLEKDQQLESNFVTLNTELNNKKSELTALNQHLTFWFDLRKKLETSGAISLADELSVLSEKVDERKIAFQEASWNYLQTLNEAQAKPEDSTLAKELELRLHRRKTAMKELEISVYSVILEKVNYYSKEITNLINIISVDTLELNYLISEIDLLAAIKNLNPKDDLEEIKTIIQTRMSLASE